METNNQGQDPKQPPKKNKRFENRSNTVQTPPNDIKDVNFMEDAEVTANTKRADPFPTIQIQSERVGAGRPKIQRRIERGKAMNVYFDENTHQLLKNMKFFHDIEMKDIPYLLTREFFKKYEVGGKLNDEGLMYIKRLLNEVN